MMIRALSILGSLSFLFLPAACGGEDGDTDPGSGQVPGDGDGDVAGDGDGDGDVVTDSGPDCELFEQPATAWGEREITSLLETSATPGWFGGTRGLFIDDDGIVYSKDGFIYRLPLDGGDAVELAPEPDMTVNTAEGQLLLSESSNAAEGMVDQWLAPFDDPDDRTQIHSYVGQLHHHTGEGYTFWEVREPSDGIWAAEIPDGTPFEIASGLLPQSLQTHDGYLYYSDWDHLYRVPVSGGGSEVVIPGGQGVLLNFQGDGYYRASNHALTYTSPIVGGEPVVLFEGSETYPIRSISPTEEGVYFSAGEDCLHIYYATGADDVTMIAGGFDGLASIAVTSDYLVVTDDNAWHRVKR